MKSTESFRGSSVWFVRLPRLVAPRLPALSYLLADGHFLVASPWLARTATPLAALTGLFWGASTWGYTRSFTESMPLLIVACLWGFFSINLGLCFALSFALGDFFLGERRWSILVSGPEIVEAQGILAALIRLRLPMIISYLLLAALIVYIPRFARLLLLDIPKTTHLPKKYAFALASILNLIVVAVLVRFWAEASAVFIRPMFTWLGRTPSIAAISVLQNQSHWFVLAAVLATAARFWFLWLAYSSEVSTQRILNAENALAQVPKREKRIRHIGPVPLAVGAALMSTLAIAGVLDNWWLPVLSFAVFLIFHLLRRGVFPSPLERWKRIIVNVPLLARLVFGFTILRSLQEAFVDEYDNTFAPLALYLLGSFVFLVVLLPGPPKADVNAKD